MKMDNEMVFKVSLGLVPCPCSLLHLPSSLSSGTGACLLVGTDDQ